LTQFRHQEIDFLLFPSSPHRRAHPELERLLSGSGAATFRLVPLASYFAIPLLAASERRTIAIKGYHGWVGGAKVFVEAVRETSEERQGYKIIVYSANKSVLKLAGLEIKAFGKGAMSHKQVLEMFARSKIYVGLSESDGISTSMLEAMAMGAIPVQTSTACCDEWFGDSGVAVHEITVPAVKNAIREGLKLAENPANAEKNLETIKSRASAEMVKKIALSFYD
jgi:glycosyltransferase involved in cell wall biosynthesis